ncbi:hypothetical protein AB1Y20_015234 [Prymnesium parvum]|uniref:Uncharacterized protein n=1 Tax=Prymnesium parvum TaxID=97485 RepID=A0AB34K1Y5_PRYPA
MPPSGRWFPWLALALFSLGYLLGRIQAPLDARDPPPLTRAASLSRASPLVAVTRQLATERRRLHELEERLDGERAERRHLQRKAVEFAPAEGGWPCGLRALRADGARLRKARCAHSAEGSEECRPPSPLLEYFVFTFSPAVDASSARIHDNGGLSSQHHLPWLDAALAAAADSGAPPLVVDVGAHFGSAVTLFALSRGARVLAVEMQPAVARALRLSAAINGWQGRLQVVEAAVGPRGGKAPIRYNSSCENSASAAVRTDARVAAKAGGWGNSWAPPVTLDEKLLALDAPVAYLRVSARWGEGYAIASMSGTIASARRQPRIIGIELHARQARDVIERLYKHGYVCTPFGRQRASAANWTAADWLSFSRSQEGYVDARCHSAQLSHLPPTGAASPEGAEPHAVVPPAAATARGGLPANGREGAAKGGGAAVQLASPAPSPPPPPLAAHAIAATSGREGVAKGAGGVLPLASPPPHPPHGDRLPPGQETAASLPVSNDEEGGRADATAGASESITRDRRHFVADEPSDFVGEGDGRRLLTPITSSPSRPLSPLNSTVGMQWPFE